jgi:hypothetical protein
VPAGAGIAISAIWFVLMEVMDGLTRTVFLLAHLNLKLYPFPMCSLITNLL